jgi:hypothetical protein
MAAMGDLYGCFSAVTGRGDAILRTELGVRFAVFGVDVAGVLDGVAIVPEELYRSPHSRC